MGIVPRSLISLVAVCLVLGAAASAAPQPGRAAIQSFPNPADYEVGSREWLKAVEAVRYRALLSDSLTQNCPHSFDVLHYNIALYIDFGGEAIAGYTVVTSEAAESLSAIDLDFTILTVDSVLGEGGSLAYLHADPVLTIDLGREYAPGDTFDVQVFYHGQPGNEGPSGFGGFYFEGLPVKAFQMGVGLEAVPSSMGKYWFPCWDWPCDKATAEYHITVAGTVMKAICNGTLVDTVVDTVANRTTYVWEENYPIAPHVMTVNAGRFSELVDSTYDWIHYWVNPRDVADALIHFGNVHVMMDGYIQRYGPYPFDKFGYVVEAKGDMEHQTCVTHTIQALQPNHLYDWLLAHEMSHMWWGDCVSVGDWRDIWLSEGFATYSEAIFKEHAYGMDDYHAYINLHIMNPVLASGENFPIYDPAYLWGTTVYEKGASVLHMLRHVIGDSMFFDALAAHRAAHEYGNAVTPEFQATVEAVSGQDLDWFFTQWIYDVGYPKYEYSWLADSTSGGYNLNLVIDQVQTNGPVFTMPVDVKVTMAAGDSLFVVWVDEEHEAFDLVMPGEPTTVEIDPDNWILKTAVEVPYAAISERVPCADLSLEQNRPNPFGQSTWIRFSIPRPQHVRLEIYDAAGRKIAKVVDGPCRAGGSEAVWDGCDAQGREVSPGTYFCCLTTEDGRRVRRLVLLK
jgi:aminopeptidase N